MPHKNKSDDYTDGEVIIFDIPNSKIKYYDSNLVAILSAISIMEEDFHPNKYFNDHEFNIVEDIPFNDNEPERGNPMAMWSFVKPKISIPVPKVPKILLINTFSYLKNYAKKKESMGSNFDKELLNRFNNDPKIKKITVNIKADKPNFSPKIWGTDFNKIVCVQAKLNNPRIERQQGSFLLFGISKEGKIKPASITQDIKINRIVIPEKYKEDIRKELEIFGISKRSLFPELADQAEFIKEKYRKK